MGAIVEAAVCGAVGKAVLFLVILPMGVLFLGHLVYIVAGSFKELRKSRKEPDAMAVNTRSKD